jgi:hypothetical protein
MRDISSIICTFKFLCDKQWDDLSEIAGEARVRYCKDCTQSVFLCSSYEEVADRASRSQCIALQDEVAGNFRVGSVAFPD